MTRQFRAHKPKPARAVERPAKRPGAAAVLAKPAKTGINAGTAERPKEIGGPSGPEPTRYGDWERKGICVDF